MPISETAEADLAIAARVAAVERELPASLPADYRAFLSQERPSFAALGPWDLSWEKTVSAFQQEWQPLRGHLLPVEYCGDGVFACLLLGWGEECPVVAWDVAADLGAQPSVQLAPDWATYSVGRITPAGLAEQGPVLDPLSLATQTIQLRRRFAEDDLDARVRSFELAERHFNAAYERDHGGSRFEHHLEHGQVRGTDWRPERFAVQDHLIGVVASRYSKATNTIDVVGFATRDHTNFARGSATAGLLVGLLCDCAAKAASGIRFFAAIPQGPRTESPGVIPYEVVLLAAVLGVALDPSSAVIPATAAGQLLLQLTPFDAEVRRTLAAGDLNLLRLCLTVHKQVWSPLEAALLATWSPESEQLFSGDIDAGELVRHRSAVRHGSTAALTCFGATVVETASQVAGAGSCRFRLVGTRCSLACRSTAQTAWTDAVDGSAIDIDSGRNLVIVGVASEAIHDRDADEFDQRIECMSGLQPEASVFGVVPHRARVGRHGRLVRFVSADFDLADIEMQIHQRLRKGRRIRS